MLCGLLALCACPSNPAPAPSNDDDPQGIDTSSSTGGPGGASTTFSDPDACVQSTDCADGHCVAPYDPGTQTIGPSVCVQACVDAGDLARACRDDGSCCDGLTCNPVDGFCNAQDDGTSSSSGSGSSTSEDTGTSGGSTSSGGASSSSSSSSGGSSSSSSGASDSSAG